MSIKTEQDDRIRGDFWAVGGLPDGSLARLEQAQTHSDESLEQLDTLNGMLRDAVARAGWLVGCDRFLGSAVAWEDRLARRAAIHTVERLADLPVASLRWPGWIPPSLKAKRLLVDLEMGLVRLCALVTPMASVRIGVLEAGAASAELPLLLPSHFSHGLDGWVVDLPGANRADRRRRPLAPWVHGVTARHLAGRDVDAPALANSSSSTGRDAIQSTILMGVMKTFTRAGLKGSGVAPESIPHTAARGEFDEDGDLDAAAALLGTRRYNALARKLDLV